MSPAFSNLQYVPSLPQLFVAYSICVPSLPQLAVCPQPSPTCSMFPAFHCLQHVPSYFSLAECAQLFIVCTCSYILSLLQLVVTCRTKAGARLAFLLTRYSTIPQDPATIKDILNPLMVEISTEEIQRPMAPADYDGNQTLNDLSPYPRLRVIGTLDQMIELLTACGDDNICDSNLMLEVGDITYL